MHRRGVVAAGRGEGIFKGKARCGGCHVPPLYTEPGYNLHKPEEIGIDDFQASRSPDGRFASLRAVVDHYDRHFKLELSEQEKVDLIEFLKSI